MSTPANTNANIPGGAPLVDQNGQITQVWYQFLLALFNRSGGAGTPTDITGLQQQVIAQDVEINTAVPVQLRPVLIGEGMVPIQRPVAPDFSQVMVYQPPGAYLTQASLTGYALKSSPLSQFAATTSAQLISVLSDETGSGSAVFGTAPTIAQPNIVGVTTNSNAAAGSVGEFLNATTASTALTSGTVANAASTPLSAGDWEVSGTVQINPTAGTVMTLVVAGISVVSATRPTNFFQETVLILPFGANSQVISTPMCRIPMASAGTAFLTVFVLYTGGTGVAAAPGFIRARRPR